MQGFCKAQEMRHRQILCRRIVKGGLLKDGKAKESVDLRKHILLRRDFMGGQRIYALWCTMKATADMEGFMVNNNELGRNITLARYSRND